MIPAGKGMFIWQLSQCAGGDPVRLANMAQAAGFSWICIKAADGVADFNQGGAAWQGPNLLPGAVDALRAVGIKVVGWQYIYGANWLGQSIAAREAQVAVENIQRFDFDCWLIDAESHYKRKGAAAWANTYMTSLRAACPSVSLGLCSYRYPTLHPELPWADFLRRIDFHAPQVYWILAHNPGAQLRRSVSELLALKHIPVVPVGSAYYDPKYPTWHVTIADLDEFNATAVEILLPGLTWWEWGENGRGAEYHPEWWAAISAHDWGQPVPPPQPWTHRADAFLRTLGFTGPGPEE
jgi:hypothetical protein